MRKLIILFPLVVVPLAAQSALQDRSITVADASFHIRCGGDRRGNGPLVILEAGAGDTVGVWRDVQAPISGFARVCAYDRLGSGTSGDAPEGLTANVYPDLFRRMLETAGEEPPFILVGHSFGGIIAMTYANTHVPDVLGLVLIDSSHEDQLRRFAMLPAPPPPATAPPTMSMRRSVSPTTFIEQLGRQPWSGHIPVMVLTRSPTSFQGGDAGTDERRALWLELQHDLATRSPRSQHVIAKTSGHYIQNEEPELVIDAVRRVLNRVTVVGQP